MRLTGFIGLSDYLIKVISHVSLNMWTYNVINAHRRYSTVCTVCSKNDTPLLGLTPLARKRKRVHMWHSYYVQMTHLLRIQQASFKQAVISKQGSMWAAGSVYSNLKGIAISTTKCSPGINQLAY